MYSGSVKVVLNTRAHQKQCKQQIHRREVLTNQSGRPLAGSHSGAIEGSQERRYLH